MSGASPSDPVSTSAGKASRPSTTRAQTPRQCAGRARRIASAEWTRLRPRRRPRRRRAQPRRCPACAAAATQAPPTTPGASVHGCRMLQISQHTSDRVGLAHHVQALAAVPGSPTTPGASGYPSASAWDSVQCGGCPAVPCFLCTSFCQRCWVPERFAFPNDTLMH